MNVLSENRFRIVIEADNKGRPVIKQTAGDLRQLENQAKKTGNVVSRAFSGMSRAGQGLISTFAGLKAQIALLLTTAGLTGLAASLIKTGNEFAKYRLTIETLEGAHAKAIGKWKELLQFAEDTPFRIGKVMDAYIKLKAYGIDPVIDKMRALGDASAALGGGDVMDRISLAIGQIQSQGRLLGTEVRQLKEAGIQVDQALLYGFGLRRSDYKDYAELIFPVDKIVQAIFDQMDYQFGGQMKRFMNTLEGQWEILISKYEQYKDQIMTSGGVGSFLTETLRAVNAEFDSFMTGGGAEMVGKKITEVFSGLILVGGKVADALVTIGEKFNWIWGMIGRAWEMFKAAPPSVIEGGIIGAMLIGGPGSKIVGTLAIISKLIEKAEVLADKSRNGNTTSAVASVLGFFLDGPTIDEIDSNIAKLEARYINLTESDPYHGAHSRRGQEILNELETLYIKRNELLEKVETGSSGGMKDKFGAFGSVLFGSLGADGAEGESNKYSKIAEDFIAKIQAGMAANPSGYTPETPKPARVVPEKTEMPISDEALLKLEKTYRTLSAEALPEFEAGLARINNRYKEMRDKIPELIDITGMSSQKLADLRSQLDEQQAHDIEKYIIQNQKTGSMWEAMEIGVRKYADSQKTVFEGIRDFTTGVFKNIEDSLVQMTKSGKVNFSSLADSIVGDLARIAYQMTIMKPLEGLAMNFFGSLMTSGFGGMFGGSSVGTSVDTTAPITTYSSASYGHIGGDVGFGGFGNGLRKVPSSLFRNAPRLHSGLAADEFPAILQKGEEVIPRGGRSGGNVTINVINKTDANARVEENSDDQGGMSFDVIIENIEKGISSGVASGRGSLAKVFERTYGLSRAVGAY